MFFGGGGGGSRQRGPRKGEDVVSVLEWSLEQFYNGATKKMAVNRSVICSDCEGRGGAAADEQSCSECHGSGVRVQIRRMGPMISQSQGPCSACGSKGKFIPSNKKCKTCTGRGTTKERKVLELSLSAGAPENHKLVFNGEADEHPGEIAGDVVFVCRQKPNSQFVRKGDHLLMEKKISLYEALTGTKFYVEQLDGRKLFIQNAAGDIVKPDDPTIVRGEGMPRFGNPFSHGDLFIKFHVEFPTTIGTQEAQLLAKALPIPRNTVRSPPSTSDVEVHNFTKISTEEMSHAVNEQRRGDAYEEDEEGGTQSVGCRQA